MCCVAALALASAYPVWVLLFMPAKGYDYVEDFTYVHGVRADSTPMTIVAHDRLDLVLDQRPFVLFADGHVERMDGPHLVDTLKEQLAARAAAAEPAVK